MPSISVFLRRLVYLLTHSQAERDLTEELQFHREMARRELERSGMPDKEVPAAVSRVMGNTTLAREDARAVWIAPWLEGLWQDLCHGVRSLRRSPGLLIVSALSVGLGIGLNAMLFAGVNTVYRHQPTMVDPDRVVGVEPGNANQFSYPDYRDLVGRRVFADALGFRTASLNLGSGDGVRPASVLAVTGNFFDVLGVQAQFGRTFSAEEAAAEREPRVVVVTHGFWRSRLGADPSAIGDSLTLSGQPFVIVGVLPESYRPVTGWMGASLYVPVSRLLLPTLDDRGSPSLSVLARLKPDGTPGQAQLAVTALGAALEQAFPDRNAGMSRPAEVFPAGTMQFRGTPAGFFLVAGLVWASVGLVLIIACVNVAGLLMARAAHRRREIAIRVAIGAGRARVVQGMLVESFLLVLAGAVVGLTGAAAVGSVRWSGTWGSLQDAMTLDRRVLPYALGLIALTTLLCGLVPALRATAGDVASEVRQGGDGATARLWLRHALVVGQVALSLMLIVLALLCVRSQIYVGSADLGFDINHGVVAQFSLDSRQYPGAERVRLADRVLERVARLPGVSLASVANLVPLGGESLASSFHPAGRTDIPGSRPNTYSVGPRYFQALSIPILRGRDFDASHAAGSPRVAIVNETFAKTHFPGKDAIGRIVQTVDEPEAEVIGLVRDSRIGTIGEAPQAVVYYPFAQRPRRLVVHIRTEGPPENMTSTVRSAVEGLDRTVPVSVQTLRGAASSEFSMRQAGTWLMGSIGAVGLLLAMVGLYGVMSYVVASRRVEIGIRMVLGASSARIGREVLQSSLVLVAAGVAIGGAAALGLTPALRTFLVGVSPFDPVVFGLASLFLAVVGLAAALLPAWRASRVDPMRAVKQ